MQKKAKNSSFDIMDGNSQYDKWVYKSWKRYNVRLEEIHLKEGSSDVFERRSQPEVSLFLYYQFFLLSVFTLLQTIWPKICSKSQLKSARRPLPVRLTSVAQNVAA